MLGGRHVSFSTSARHVWFRARTGLFDFAGQGRLDLNMSAFTAFKTDAFEFRAQIGMRLPAHQPRFGAAFCACRPSQPVTGKGLVLLRQHRMSPSPSCWHFDMQKPPPRLIFWRYVSAQHGYSGMLAARAAPSGRTVLARMPRPNAAAHAARTLSKNAATLCSRSAARDNRLSLRVTTCCTTSSERPVEPSTARTSSLARTVYCAAA